MAHSHTQQSMTQWTVFCHCKNQRKWLGNELEDRWIKLQKRPILGTTINASSTLQGWGLRAAWCNFQTCLSTSNRGWENSWETFFYCTTCTAHVCKLWWYGRLRHYSGNPSYYTFVSLTTFFVLLHDHKSIRFSLSLYQGNSFTHWAACVWWCFHMIYKTDHSQRYDLSWERKMRKRQLIMNLQCSTDLRSFGVYVNIYRVLEKLVERMSVQLEN